MGPSLDCNPNRLIFVGYLREPDVFKCDVGLKTLKVLQRMYELISAIATQKLSNV